MKIYLSEDILSSDDLYDLQDTFCSHGVSFQYKMTKGELLWLNYVRGRYCIGDWIDKNLSGDILTFDDVGEMSEALLNDGISCKAAMLLDETALQKLFFWLSINS